MPSKTGAGSKRLHEMFLVLRAKKCLSFEFLFEDSWLRTRGWRVEDLVRELNNLFNWQTHRHGLGSHRASLSTCLGGQTACSQSPDFSLAKTLAGCSKF